MIYKMANHDNNIITSKKLTSENWSLLEKPLTPLERKLNELVMNLGFNTAATTEYNNTSLITIGEYFYSIIKNELKNEGLLYTDELETNIQNSSIIEDNNNKKSRNKNSKNKNIKLNSSVTIKVKNTQNQINNKLEALKTILSTKPEKKQYSDLMINNNYIEFRIIILMKIISNYTSTNSTSYWDDDYEEESELEKTNKKQELLMGCKKIIYLLKNIIKDENNLNFKKVCIIDGFEVKLSEELINDFDYYINKLSESTELKLYDIANTKPRLIYDTKYDETISSIKLKPYDSQIELINTVSKNISNGFLILLKTLPGLGKTSMITSICAYIRKSEHNSKLKVIFCCSDMLESVRIQILKLAYNFNIKFGIATSSSNNGVDNYIIKNSWNCPTDTERELIVADYRSTACILEEKKHEYLLFFDEPTVLTDRIENVNTLTYLSKILFNLPKRAILSSATLPATIELDNIIQDYIIKYPDAKIEQISSNKTLIGSFIKDFNSNPLVPHIYVNKFSELKNTIKIIKDFPLVGKFYTLPFLLNLNKYIIEYGNKQDALNLDNIESFEHDNILENILHLLTVISDYDDVKNNFIKFKSLNINQVNELDIDVDKLDNNYNNFDHSKLLTVHAYKYFGCCLIATESPLSYVRKYMYPIVDKLKEKIKISSITKEYENYKKLIQEYNTKVENLELNYKPQKDEKGNFDTKEECIARIKVPTFTFRKELEINTISHIKSFAKYVRTDNIDKSMLKNCISHERIDINKYDIDDNLKFLLYMGVGIFSPGLDSAYTNKILEMLNDKELAFIIADESFCYGANYPISNVVIHDDLANNHSINTILQLIGRTARIGKSWSGKVHLDTNTSKRIIKFFSDPSFNSVEGENINNSYIKYKQDYFFKKAEKEKEEKIRLERLEKINLEKERLKQLEKIKLEKQNNNSNNISNHNKFKNTFGNGWIRGSALKSNTNTNTNKWTQNKVISENNTNKWTRNKTSSENNNYSKETNSWSNIRGTRNKK